MKLLWLIIGGIGVTSCNYKESLTTFKEILFKEDSNLVVIIRSRTISHREPYIMSGEGGFKFDRVDIYPVGVRRNDTQAPVINYPVIRCVDVDPCLGMAFKFLKCGNFIVPENFGPGFSITGFDPKRKTKCLAGVEKETFKMRWENF